MSPDPKHDRDTLLAELRATRDRRFSPAGRQLPVPARQDLLQQEENLKLRYQESLPQVPISRCPIDGSLVHKRMDIFGLDGLWWEVGASDELPIGDSRHVITYTGALRAPSVDLAGAALTKRARILPGPEVPYVIPRLLHIPGVRCVISWVQLFSGRGGAYLTTYFAEPGFPAREAHQMWLRESFDFLDDVGHRRWRIATDRWDFDLVPWLRDRRDKVYWIAPSDPAMTAITGSPEQCPYVDAPGARFPREIKNGVVRGLPLPEPSSSEDYFD
jgi:hypothetical protein